MWNACARSTLNSRRQIHGQKCHLIPPKTGFLLPFFGDFLTAEKCEKPSKIGKNPYFTGENENIANRIQVPSTAPKGARFFGLLSFCRQSCRQKCTLLIRRQARIITVAIHQYGRERNRDRSHNRKCKWRELQTCSSGQTSVHRLIHCGDKADPKQRGLVPMLQLDRLFNLYFLLFHCDLLS